MLRFASLRQRNPPNGVPEGFCVKMPPDHDPLGNPGPTWLTFTPSTQMACSPFDALTGLFSLTICSTHIHWPALPSTFGLLRSRFPQYFPSLDGCISIQ